MKNIKQNELFEQFNIPPSRANIRVVGPLTSLSELNTKFSTAGLTSEDLEPIDWRSKVDLSPILNQKSCGDCWAMSSTSALSDKFIIEKKIKNLILEPAITAQCASSSNGCGGGSPSVAVQYFETNGVPSVDVVKCPSWKTIYNEYSSNGTPNLPSCDTIINLCEKSTFYKSLIGSYKNLAVSSTDRAHTINNIKLALMEGPLVACFFVPIDFQAPALGYNWRKTNGIYVNGMYNDDLDKLATPNEKNYFGISSPSDWGNIIMENGSPAAHAVSIVGWGKDGDAGAFGKTTDYWIVRNSWGDTWNENGYFRIAMNIDGNTNNQLAFDIPTLFQNTLFGGCITFKPDLTTGAPFGHEYLKGGLSSKKNRKTLILLIVGAVILAIFFIYFLIKKRR